MSLTLPLVVIIVLAVIGSLLARRRALSVSGGDIRHLASLPKQHGLNAILSTVVPPLLAIVVWLMAARILEYRGLAPIWVPLAIMALALAGVILSVLKVSNTFRARTASETWIKVLLIGASTIAILTTIGIVFSMLFETVSFFQQYPWQKFFFSTNWSPNFRGNSDLGILPLLWGTLYISFIALAFAVPTGLFAAIYLSEYASPRVRGIAKPAIEILAGIPTIVYGLFALTTVGPFLRDYFAQPMGFGDSASSVMTAGLVMGIMLIPFVSSLSDDIINAVPQAMRDGSLGLGATKSETIRQVVVPAALPGIVGAVLLAASRAIGETMIVVLGAGAAARISLNPFEAMTTVTVKIVSQLTGDTDFASPETLVAFALGLTLFVITLGLNVLALFIVRRYREQYE
ncbi:phosphate ABC transporter permease subunit PstC [Loktanella sp. M215]|uniref:phosphate ABC transporter permease subunit PstC n=1 Tax=Loktanella sp. M215 TaxID=2675431 RepID=UPI001F011EBD|nr:phosphate ABC transporter permease subunit PstC [Loktanella sp. M215]MBU2358622.1 phosphate ABC transporter permease subunit PstC [Alphaproteobacteria bacterium]MCF7700602.1 phosphate ABC transporter permease subunit PstC [Loktanella sp. M215]